MSDDQGATSRPVPAEPRGDPQGEPEEFPVDRLRRRLGRRMGGRPLMVYVVLFAGAATLLLLLAVVWISATNNDGDEAEICTEIAPAEAAAEILDGQVRRIRVLVDQDQPVETLTGVVLEFVDDACRQTRMGADLRPQLLGVLGAVQLYNEFNEERGVRITYTQQDIQRELLATSTPTPTATPTATPTVAPATPTSAVVIVDDTPTPPEAAVATGTPTVATGTPAATATAPVSPARSPTAGAPRPSPTP